MNTKKIIFYSVLFIFIVGMTLSPASASHTFKVGKYKATVSDKQYNKLKKAKKNDGYYDVTVKTKNTYKIKKYKYKTVTKKKWKYKKVLIYKDIWNSDWTDSTYYTYDDSKYYKNGWIWYGSSTSEENGGHIHKTYAKYKKKVNTKVKVKTNKYTTVKKHYTMYIESNGDAWVYKGNDIAKIGTVKI